MSENEQPWGRVDDNNVAYVRDGDDWREVGQYGGVTPEEALAYFVRKYDDLASQISLLEARSKRGAPAKDIAQAVSSLRQRVQDAKAIGDLAKLAARLDALDAGLSELTEAQRAESEAARQAAIVERTKIVEAIEALAAADPAKTQWKQTGARVDELFAQWQRHQKEGPQLPKGVATELWKRFRTARSTIDAHRRAFFGELDATNKQAKAVKQKLISRAEALAPKGAGGVEAYRELLDEWKRAPRAGKKLDDTLWAQFKAAGDVLYAAKAEIDQAENAVYAENLAAKEALLAEGQSILALTDLEAARSSLRALQSKWDAIGKVPRDAIRRVDEQLRQIEQHVRSLADAKWSQSDPEKIARAEGLAGQLQDAIAQLTAELQQAEKSGNAKAIAEAKEALAARQAWLAAIQN